MRLTIPVRVTIMIPIIVTSVNWVTDFSINEIEKIHRQITNITSGCLVFSLLTYLTRLFFSEPHLKVLYRMMMTFFKQILWRLLPQTCHFYYKIIYPNTYHHNESDFDSIGASLLFVSTGSTSKAINKISAS